MEGKMRRIVPSVYVASEDAVARRWLKMLQKESAVEELERTIGSSVKCKSHVERRRTVPRRFES